MKTPLSILVVDDHPGLVASIGLLLSSAGYCVLAAGDGVEALAVLRSHPVDFILSDIDMPRMNGYQLREHVRENLQWGIIPFIFMTGHATDCEIYSKELGVDDILIKPIAPHDLLATVRGKLRRADYWRSCRARPLVLTA